MSATRRQRFLEQVEIIRTAIGPVDFDDLPGTELACVFQDDRMLVREHARAEAKNRFGAQDGDFRHGELRLMGLPEPGARAAVDHLNSANGMGSAAYNHVLSIASDGGANLCPAAEPVTTALSEVPPVAEGTAGDGVRVLVIDTGVVPELVEQVPFLSGVHGGDRRPLVQGAPIPIYRGHGTFIAGVLRCVAPKAVVEVHNDFRDAGSLTETQLVAALREVLAAPDGEVPDIISFSAGAYLSPVRRDPMLIQVVQALVRRGREKGRPVLVAAAGNDGQDGTGPLPRFLPAGLEGVVSVGALRQNGRGRACFSNYGDWVSCYAPGERLVNAFAPGRYVYQHNGFGECQYLDRPDRYEGCTCLTQPAKGSTATFDNGRAEWSGTSFATPIVAGLIAGRMSRGAETARAAADWLLAHPADTVEGLGRVLRPDMALA